MILILCALCLWTSGCSKKDSPAEKAQPLQPVAKDPANGARVPDDNQTGIRANGAELKEQPALQDIPDTDSGEINRSDDGPCLGFNCPCGNTFCATGSTCKSGVCYCGDRETKLAATFYECVQGQMKCIGFRGFDLCECGPKECSQGTICMESEGSCLCDGKPSPKFAQMDISGWVCEDGRWICASGSKNFGIGCVCEDVRCIWGSSCENGKCRCGADIVSANPEQYACADGRVVCDTIKGCDCGTARCAMGERCEDGACKRQPPRILEGNSGGGEAY